MNVRIEVQKTDGFRVGEGGVKEVHQVASAGTTCKWAGELPCLQEPLRNFVGRTNGTVHLGADNWSFYEDP